MSQALQNDNYAWLSEAEIRATEKALISNNKATPLGFFDMAARASRKLVRAVNAKMNGVIVDP